ncbi:hypothetical protein PYCCODRAFT_1367182, partial [Trametes coccinea BRFM310]
VKAAIAGKTAEVELLKGKLEHAYLFAEYKDAIAARFVQVREQNKVPTLKYVDNNGIGVDAALSTDVTVEGWLTNPAIVAEFNDLALDLVSIAARAIAIINQRESAMQLKIEKKKQVEKSADVEMADATQPGPSLQSLLDRTVKGQLKPLAAKLEKLSLKGEKKSGNKKAKVTTKSSSKPEKKTSSSSSKKKASPSSAKKSNDQKGKGKGKAKAGTYSAAPLPYPIVY